jgi:hypothetical protein
MMDYYESKSSLAILDVANGSILKEYRETPTNYLVTRGPEVAQVKSQSMLYASDETIHVAFRDNSYRNGFFSFSALGSTPSFVQIF